MRTARLLTPGDPGVAEDLVQTALTKAYVHWPRITQADQPLAFVHRILATTAIDERRRAWRRREFVTETLPDQPGLDPVGAGDPERTAQALRALPAGQRAVVVLRHWLDYSVEQTADLLGCSTGTVKSQNARALAALRAALQDLEPLSTGVDHD